MTVRDRLSASLTVHVSSRFVLIKSFGDFMLLSTNPVAVCIYDVPYISFMFSFLPTNPISFPVKDVHLSVLTVCGIPFSRIYCSRNVFAVFLVGTSHIHAAVHLLYRSMENCIKSLSCLNLIGPMKSKWRSWFDLSTGGE